MKRSQSISQKSRFFIKYRPSRPEDTYDTYENLRASVSAFTRTQGYAVTVAKSTGGRKYWLKCDRGGPPRRVLEEKRKHKGATKI